MKYLTTEEVAKLIRCQASTVRRLIKSGDLPATRIGNRHRIDAGHLVRFIRKGENDNGYHFNTH